MDDKSAALKAVRLLDLTSLSNDDTDEGIADLARRAATPAGPTAALCVYPRFVPIARRTLNELNSSSQVATVCVFPHGRADVELAATETRACVAYGADEVDTVLPNRALIGGDEEICRRQLKVVREACDGRLLKVILETGELKSPELIRLASDLAIECGADFIKTSTGKVPINATPEAAQIMLDAIAESNPSCGLKIAGGVRTTQDAAIYLSMAAERMGEDYLRPERFRFGASSLLNALLETLGEDPTVATDSGY